MKTQKFSRITAAAFAGVAIIGLTGCASTFNTAENDQYACPGMPMQVTCKTPAAVYKSTQGQLKESEFDTPIDGTSQNQSPQQAKRAEQGYRLPQVGSQMVSPSNQLANSATTEIGVKPIREPARVVRIWIAPWIDKNDNLNLAQYQFTEVKPRTWTVGTPERGTGRGYIIPRQAVQAASAGTAATTPTAAPANNLPSIPESRALGAPSAQEPTQRGGPARDDGLPPGYSPFPSKDAP